MGHALKKVGHVVTKGLDYATGDILDLDKSKQRDAIRKQREEELRRQNEIKAAQEREESYQRSVSQARAGLDQNQIQSDSTGVGLGDVKIDFSKQLKKKEDEDDLKNLLGKY